MSDTLEECCQLSHPLPKHLTVSIRQATAALVPGPILPHLRELLSDAHLAACSVEPAANHLHRTWVQCA